MEVKRQIDSMQELDDKEDPNFSDTDYLLAAYAASLRVLTFTGRLRTLMSTMSFLGQEDLERSHLLKKS